MLNQENIYQLIIREQWTTILELLYSNKNDIALDGMLRHAAIVFEKEFFSKISHYSLDDKIIESNLDTLYILNFGKYYELSSQNYEILIIEIVKRKNINEAINYARIFPNHKVSKKVISIFNKSLEKDLHVTDEPLLDWAKIYNLVFELINVQSDTATYYSGPRFINTVREFDASFPDYTRYIDLRNRAGKSTTRKIFYYDILIGLSEELRIKIIKRILQIIRPFQEMRVKEIDLLFDKRDSSKSKKEASLILQNDSPVVFISYSWDNESHKDWVLNLANRLCSDGIDVILDRFSLNPGKNLPYFVEKSIKNSNRIIIVFTPNYKLKADSRVGGVGYEYSIMNIDLYSNQTTTDKIIPVLRSGSKQDSIPVFMQQFIHIDASNDVNFEDSYLDLVREIYNEPAIQKPQLGKKPVLRKKVTLTK